MSTTAVHHSGSTDPSPARWADLPDDLFAMIRLRAASIRDRVCLAAVCGPWHAAASSLPPPPAVPLLLLSPRGPSGKKHLCGPDGSWVLRVPSKLHHRRFVGSHQGGWIAATDDRTLVIVNLFSGAEVVLSAKQHTIASICTNNDNCVFIARRLHKVIFSEHPTSSNGSTLAGLRGDKFHIVLCRVGCSGSAWSEKGWYEELISDIAFCNGELYGLTTFESLIKFEIGAKEDGTPMVTAIHKMAIKRRDGPRIDDIGNSGYIIELNGELSLALRNRWLPNKEPVFRVFKLVDVKDNESYNHKWELTNLDNHALFLGPAWSKAVHVTVGECRGVERNHIYYAYSTWLNDCEFPGDMVYSVTTDDGDRMCCRTDRSIGSGAKLTGYYTTRSYKCALWVYPPDL